MSEFTHTGAGTVFPPTWLETPHDSRVGRLFQRVASLVEQSETKNLVELKSEL